MAMKQNKEQLETIEKPECKANSKTEKLVKDKVSEKKLVKANELLADPALAEQNEDLDMQFSFKPSILFVASEANPFVGTGGLADVIGALPKELAKSDNYDVKVILPLYDDVDKVFRAEFKFECNFNVPLSWRNQYCGLYSYKYEGVTFFFIDNEYYFKRKGLYGFYDDGERFAFFSKATLEMMHHIDYYPEILHCHDWQTALSVVYLKTLYSNRYGYDHIKALFTIHNIEYQGKYGHESLQDLFGLPEAVRYILDYNGCINLMKGAIEFSDRFSTVSPSYSREILNPFFAHGLEYEIKRNEFKLTGILNGIDESVYNSMTDDKLFANFSAEDLSGKAVCKRELQKMLSLPEDNDVPIISIITRLVAHKGLDLIKQVFEDILSENVQVVILGKGEIEYEEYFKYIAEKYSGKCRVILAYNKDLASKIYSGSDIFLMPSKQEPCGLSQMICTRYGTVPIVRQTGGLKDSIIKFNDENNRGQGNGFVFVNYNAHEMLYVIKDAIYTFGNKDIWNKLIVAGMKTDFSWGKSAKTYENLYKNILI